MQSGKRLFLAWIAWGILGSLTAGASVGPPRAGILNSANPSALAPVAPVVKAKPRVEGSRAKRMIQESFRFLLVEHGFRMTQAKTRQELVGPFFKDYGKSVKGLGGWGDGDGVFVNYVAHPMQGAGSGFVQVQNDPRGQSVEFGRSKAYWHSRLKAMAWGAIYSTQFELGPFSESSIGNVGLNKGTAGWVDLIMTPLGGLGFMVAEDALDRFVLRGIESRTESKRKLAFYRTLCNPTRTFSKLMQGRLPWSKDWRGAQQTQRAGPKEPPRDLGTFPAEEEFLSGPTLVKQEGGDGWRRSLIPFGLGKLIFPGRPKHVTHGHYKSPDQSAPAALLIIQHRNFDARLDRLATETDPGRARTL